MNGLPIFVSSEESSTYNTKYDEKHYFVIPYNLSEVGFSLHTMRCLPPSVPGLLNKHGLKPVGEKLSKNSIEKAAKEAEIHVNQQFSCSGTLKVVNPVPKELELALRTTEIEHDPLTDFNLSDGCIQELDGERWRELTEKAVWHIYIDILRDPGQYAVANLGPEDVRWLKTLLEY